ncbi:ArnT family glycosyltransferase [Solicola gregarius]|uniref:Glycosyltransferase family 39 protein n=1 Tax=Solicola gregarius TaxID=2908642 RepID=A0AA46TKG1_9ACTN|nr:glycosyltransferase family 39 protein [Solicola gregarius]UYM06527.1 glycosyltransferase family 39 protein [Solicola gregarius]
MSLSSGLAERSAGWLRTTATRFDPLVFVVGAVSLVVYALHDFDGKLSRDLGLYSYAGQQFADGVPPYEAVMNRAGPLAHMIPGIGAWGARIVGVEDLTGMRVLFLFITVASVCVTYLFARELFDSRLAGLSAAFAFLTFTGIIELATNGPREKTPMLLFMLCAMWAAHRHRWVTAGAMLSLATLTLQIAFPAGFVAVVGCVLAVRRGERLRALVRVALGGLGVLLLFVVYFAAAGALEEFVEGFVLINAEYTAADPFTDHAQRNWENLQSEYGASLWVGIVGIVSLLVVSASAVRRTYRDRHPNAITIAALGLATIVALIWTLREYDSWPDAMLVLPTAAIGIGALAKEVVDRAEQRWARAAALAWVMAAVVMATSVSVDTRHHELVDQRASVRAKLRPLPDDATIMSINAPQPLVLSGKTNPIQHQMFFTGLNEYVDETWPGGLEGLGEWVAEERPTLIAVGGSLVPDWLAETLERDYTKVGSAPGWVWYADRSIGHRLVKKVRHAGNRHHRR